MEEFMPTPITEKPVALTDSNSELSKIYIGKKTKGLLSPFSPIF